MKKITTILVGCLAALSIAIGCKSPTVISDSVKDDEVEESVSAYRSVIVEVQTGTEKTQPGIEKAHPVIEEVQLFTENVQPIAEDVQPIVEDIRTRHPESEPITGYYSVQVGAFTDALNADNALRKIRQRFDLEVKNDYDPVEQLFKITIGRFAGYDHAQTFRDRMINDYPGEYIDAWIVDMAQRKY